MSHTEAWSGPPWHYFLSTVATLVSETQSPASKSPKHADKTAWSSLGNYPLLVLSEGSEPQSLG